MGLRPDSLLKVGARQTSEGGASPLSDLLLRLIWQQRRVSRADLARRADMSRSTVSEIVNDLLPTGLVAEVGAGQSRGGRRPIVLEFQDEAFVILGVDMGAAHVAVALTDLRGQVLAWKHARHDVRSDPEGTRRTHRRAERRMPRPVGRRDRTPGRRRNRRPQPGRSGSARVLSEVVLPAWRGRDWLDDLQVRYGVPVLVDNDANLGALAERWWGAGLGVDDFAYIKVATGIGAGHIVGGEIYRGATGIAGEIGHLAIDPLGRVPLRPATDASTTCVGGRALIDRAAALVEKTSGERAGRIGSDRRKHRGCGAGGRPTRAAGRTRSGRAPGHRGRRPRQHAESGDGDRGWRTGASGRPAAGAAPRHDRAAQPDHIGGRHRDPRQRTGRAGDGHWARRRWC